jgi:hypothetical protein
MIHRRLLLPVPRRDSRDPPPDRTTLGNARVSSLALEVYRPPSGSIEIAVAGETEADLTTWSAAYEGVFPGGEVDPRPTACPFPVHGFVDGVLARARVERRHHWWPIKIDPAVDYASTLARTITSPLFQDHEVLLQLLARPTGEWESSFHLLAGHYDKLVANLNGVHEPLLGAPTKRPPTDIEKRLHTQVVERRALPSLHVEMRLGILGPDPKGVLQAVNGWVRQWESINGGIWWSFARVRNGLVFSKHRVLEFREVFRNHDLQQFRGRKERRNISSKEWGFVLPLPWRNEHPGLPYASSPAAGHVPEASLGPMAAPPSSPLPLPRPGPVPSVRLPQGFRGTREEWARTVARYEELRSRFPKVTPRRGLATARGAVAIPAPSPTPIPRSVAVPSPPCAPSSAAGISLPQLNPALTGLVVGHARGQLLGLPPDANHLAVLGRTQTGKSTEVLNLILQLLAKRPEATVVLLEPTGGLVRDVVQRIDPSVAADTILVDPAHPTYRDGGQSRVTVPLGILHIPEHERTDQDDLERRSELVAGDILLMIKNAWGEESIGARADFILRPVLQGLLASRGTNLVDAYNVLSDSEVRRRFLRTLPEGSAANFLRFHLPGLDYAFTMSSLNKVGKIATNPMLRKSLCQRVDPVPFETLLKHRLLLLNLSKGELGTEGSNFLGAIFLTQLWSALLRTGSKEHPVYLVVDEFQNYDVPIFSDMLSEGAKFGLHIVAVTQFLHQVEEKVRASLGTNVSAWLFLALGVEDMQLAWRVADGERRGWVPQDFVNGLPGHQLAMAAGSSFCKMETFPAPPPRPDAPAVAEAVARSSRRYARIENAEVSPFQTSPGQLAMLLQGLEEEPRGREDLATSVPLLPDRFEVVLLRALQLRDVFQDEDSGEFLLTPRGRIHLAAVRAERNEGEEHSDIIAIVGAFLDARAIGMKVGVVQPTLTAPDGEFRVGETDYSLEVECSTLQTHFPQVMENLRKAVPAKRLPFMVVPSRDAAERMVYLVAQADRSLRLWEKWGLAWVEGEDLVPYQTTGSAVWKFLEAAPRPAPPIARDRGESAPAAPTSPSPSPAPPFDRDTARALEVGLACRRAGKRIITHPDFVGALRPDEREWWTPERLGHAMGALGIEGFRKRQGGARLTFYDLGPLERHLTR